MQIKDNIYSNNDNIILVISQHIRKLVETRQTLTGVIFNLLIPIDFIFSQSASFPLKIPLHNYLKFNHLHSINCSINYIELNCKIN